MEITEFFVKECALHLKRIGCGDREFVLYMQRNWYQYDGRSLDGSVDGSVELWLIAQFADSTDAARLERLLEDFDLLEDFSRRKIINFGEWTGHQQVMMNCDGLLETLRMLPEWNEAANKVEMAMID